MLECSALVRAIRRGDLDKLIIPESPVDVLAQQIVATCASEEWDENAMFELARRALDSNVDWRPLNVYDISREALGGFDFAFVGTLLLHLRNPVDALSAIRRVLELLQCLAEVMRRPITDDDLHVRVENRPRDTQAYAA